MPAPTTDFSIFDAIELVTYSSLVSPEVANVPAVRRPITQSRQRNVERYIELEQWDVVLHLDAAALESVVLSVGDQITDAGGVEYSVLFLERQTLDNSVVTVCRPVNP
jgi:hypothetical protein